MKATGQIAERAMPFLSLGMAASVRFVNDVEVPGQVTYISDSADPQTRTFRVEIESANPTGLIKDGLTVVSTLQLPAVTAHLISPNILTLNDEGQVGLRTVGADNKVVFAPVTVLGDSAEGMWIGGLEDQVTVITVGHEYVIEGQIVEPVLETAELAQ
jgi:multidrug efflux system membrane fusion protein